MSIDVNAAQAAAHLLLPGWRDPAAALTALPDSVKPADDEQAYAIQRVVMHALGEIGGWKVGASSPAADALISCAPMPLMHFHQPDETLSSHVYTYRAVEAEIAFRLRCDLPPRDAPYEIADIVDAIGSCHTAIEILQSRYRDPDSPDRLSAMADLINHGAFVPGPEIPDWRSIDWPSLYADVIVDGESRIRRQGNPAGEMMRLIVWMANVGARWAGGLKAGQFVTTGSWTGKLPVSANSAVEITFTGVGGCRIGFSDAE